MADQVLERFHRALIEEIQTQRPEYLTQPFTVAEIYQNLVPYGSHRDRIGVEMNGDYEDALVRLLAGEGGYLILDSEPALKKLQSELDAKNPNTGVYREYAAVDVRLNQAYLDLSAEAMDQLPDLVEELEAEDPVTMTDLAPAEGNASAGDAVTGPPVGDIFADYVAEGGEAETAGETGAGSETVAAAAATTAEEPPSDEGGSLDDEDGGPGGEDGAPGGEGDGADGEVDGPHEGDDMHDRGEGPDEASDANAPEGVSRSSSRPPLAPEYVDEPEQNGAPPAGGAGGERAGAVDGSCVWCRAGLPERDDVNYCPFCGTDLRLVPCASCGAEIEPGWMFCAACGTEVDA